MKDPKEHVFDAKQAAAGGGGGQGQIRPTSRKPQQVDKGGAWRTKNKEVNPERKVPFAPQSEAWAKWDPLRVEGGQRFQVERLLESFINKKGIQYPKTRTTPHAKQQSTSHGLKPIIGPALSWGALVGTSAVPSENAGSNH